MDIERELESVFEKNKGKFTHTGDVIVANLAKDCLDEIRRLKQMHRWIPVSERLPEQHNTVIFAMPNGKYWNIATGWISHDIWYNIYGSRLTAVTHWQPLPEPPVE